MSFRRNSAPARRWNEWLVLHRETLVGAGVPDFLYVSEGRWINFLAEGGWDAETGWRVEMLSAGQAEMFRQFLIEMYGDDLDRCCLRALDQHLLSVRG